MKKSKMAYIDPFEGMRPGGRTEGAGPTFELELSLLEKTIAFGKILIVFDSREYLLIHAKSYTNFDSFSLGFYW